MHVLKVKFEISNLATQSSYVGMSRSYSLRITTSGGGEVELKYVEMVILVRWRGSGAQVCGDGDPGALCDPSGDLAASTVDDKLVFKTFSTLINCRALQLQLINAD